MPAAPHRIDIGPFLRPTHRCVCLSVWLSVCLCVCLFVCE